MSRIGKLPISIPAGVTVNYDEASHVCTVKGPRVNFLSGLIHLSSLIMQMVRLALKSMKIVL